MKMLDDGIQVEAYMNFLYEVFGEEAEELRNIPFAELKCKVSELLEKLTEREKIFIGVRYGLDVDNPKTLPEMGKMYGVTSERVRQIIAKAERKLRVNKDAIL